jgi:hypothetical protein
VDSSSAGYDPLVGSCEHCNKLTGYIQVGQFLDQLSDYRLLKVFAPCISLVYL